ncbi:hypothetical protein E0Z10_g7604 [Xylaria hypoxylon]|uniref:Zn(2)-C6 fungal-type domain-containing protein n=1 Tax=Xylaria hypoxylon TaxID=37992 RepID=A0A4Z0YM21_9PEZI|nr:hypothetical protein E0Z10_g7604 [Xylaria hypoxylon]
MEQKQPSGPPQGRQKMNYACEACRAAKTKCQSGPQPDICKRYSVTFLSPWYLRHPSRCISPRGDPEAAGVPPRPGPSKTFSIDFDMPVLEVPTDDFETLRQQHERILEDLVLNSSGDDEDEQQGGEDSTRPIGSNLGGQQTFSFNDMTSSPSVSLSGAESSAGLPAIQKSKPMLNLGIKPQFNLDSATKLLTLFRDMLPHMPCLVLPENLEVRSLARNSPFMLLAILAVTSSSSSLQGHSLYDEEFRKVLSLKFVANGERSLELLQGILIYCSWYPFHLRPRNKQSFQYLRMAVDIVHDLDMEQDSDLDLSPIGPAQRARKVDNVRALLGCFYAISSFSATWNRTSTLRYSPQLSRCADSLDQSGELEQDHHLAWLVRLQYIFEELVEVHRNFERGPRDHQSEMQRNIIRVGLGAQFRDFRETMPEQYASTTSILLVLQVTEAMMLVPPLLHMPRKFNSRNSIETIPSDHLLHAAHKVRAVFNHVTSLTSHDFSGFSGADYGRFIIAVILAYRLSFPLPGICRNYDVAQGRRILDLGAMLRKLVKEPDDEGQGDPKGKGGNKGGATPTTKPRKSDAASALRIVLRSVMMKFEEKSAAFEAMSAAATGEEWATRDLRSTCPMLNGSLDEYIPLWAGEQSAGSHATSQTSSSRVTTTAALSSDLGFVGPMEQMGLGVGSIEDKPLMYHDLWTTMTTGWGDMGEVNMEDIGNTGLGYFTR